jgi:hypothetical protein
MGSTIYSWSKGKGMFTFYGGHDPKTASGGEAPTVLIYNLIGYRLILNNVLFPAAERKTEDLVYD